jgi:hypothetical protein
LRSWTGGLVNYPRVAQWEFERVQFEVARALAGNSRVLLQVNGPDDLARMIVLRVSAVEKPGMNGDQQPEPAQELEDINRVVGNAE